MTNVKYFIVNSIEWHFYWVKFGDKSAGKIQTRLSTLLHKRVYAEQIRSQKL